MIIKEGPPGDSDFTISDDEETSRMSEMPVTDPSMAPTVEQIQQETRGGTIPDGPASPAPPNSAYPISDITSFAASQPVDRSMFGPAGRWRKGVFSCCDSFFSGLFWMGCCCTPCLYGQLMQRLNLTWIGQRPPPGRRVVGTCTTVFTISMIMYFLYFLFGGWIATILWYLFLFYFFFMGILLRSVIRRRFGIAPTTLPVCDGVLEDFALAFCCSCCSGIQMARHTHDEDRFPYNGCSSNGLPSYAPDLWEGLLDQDSSGPPAEQSAYTTASTARANGDAARPEGYMANIEIV